MNKFLDHWDTFWYRRVPPHALAIVRIAFAIYLLVEAATYFPVVPQMFSTQALTWSHWAPKVPEFFRPLFELPSPAVAWCIASAYLFACAGLLLGFGMRICIAALIALTFYYWQISFFLFPSSYHRIYLILLCALFISGADKTFSLRMLRTHGSMFAWEPVSIFAQRLVTVQMMFTYAGVGLQKTWLPAWQDGAALSMSLVGRWATSWGRWVVARNLPFSWYSASVHGITLIEVMLPFLLWSKTWRWFGVLAGASFHIGIGVLMSIWWFIALIPCYILFWQPEEVFNACKKYSRGRIQ